MEKNPDVQDAQRLMTVINTLLEEMTEQQRRKTLKTARRLRPNVTDDDIQDPHSIPELARSPEFSYEDGMLAGIAAARVAILRDAGEFFARLADPRRQEPET